MKSALRFLGFSLFEGSINRRRVKRDIEIINSSTLFERDWYARTQIGHHAVGTTSSWKDPAEHFARNWRNGMSPSPQFDATWYLQTYPDVALAGINPLVHFENFGRREGRVPLPAPIPEVMVHDEVASPSVEPTNPAVEVVESSVAMSEFHAHLANHLIALSPLRIKDDTSEGRRISVVTDSIGPASLFGGVATALIFAASLARVHDADLRVITRNGEGDSGTIRKLLDLNHVQFNNHISILESGPRTGYFVPVRRKGDVFVTTSWWTTHGVLASIPAKDIVYILQEDERMFYGHGDDRLRCEEVLNNESLTCVLNTELLSNHLTDGPSPLAELANRSVFFEPAFPSMRPAASKERPGGKRKFFFYGRPNNIRNLYWRGIEAICEALTRGIINAADWEFHFAGKDLPFAALPGNPDIYFHQQMSWDQYAALLRNIDVGLTLMDTPHPSYPPLDLAASGAIAVTNASGIKRSLDQYSKNIICTDRSLEGLLVGIAKAVNLDESVRLENLRNAQLAKEWGTTLQLSINYVSKRLPSLHV